MITLNPQYPIIPFSLQQFNFGRFIGNQVLWQKQHCISNLPIYHPTSTDTLALHTCDKAVNALSKSGKRLTCDFPIVIKEWETTSFCHYVPSNHFLCGNYGNMLIMSRTCHASIIQIMPRSCSLSPSDRKLLKLQGYEQQSFVESIGGEESPSASDCITLHDRYGLDLYVFHAVLSGETNERQCTLDSCIFHAMLSGEPNGCQRLFLLPHSTLHLTPHQYSVVAHWMQHGYHIPQYSIATYPLWLEFMHLSLWPSPSSSNLPEIPLPLVRAQRNVSEFFAMSCSMIHVATPLA